jgi:germination protein M
MIFDEVPDRDTDVEPAPAPPPPRSLAKPIFIGALLVGLGLWLVLAMLPGFLSRQPAAAREGQPSDAAPAQKIQATLFYVSDDGAELVSVVREVPFGATSAEQARQIVMVQVRTPGDGLVSAIPQGTVVRGVFIGSRGDAYVDLNAAVLKGHGGGTLNEALAVFAIVNAVTSNLPDVSTVQILVEGKEIDSLAGHLDLRQPIGRAADWIRKGQ